MQAAMATLQRQLQAALATHSSTEQQLQSAQAELVDSKQQVAHVHALFANSSAAQNSSNQSIAALQESALHHAAAVTASEATRQTLLAEMDRKDEQLKQVTGKLHAAEHAAAAAQDAAHRLQSRLTGQQAEANDQNQELTEALEVGSITVHQLELTIQALQSRVFAADNAMESQQGQLCSQQATASAAVQDAEQLAQQLSSKNSLIASLQTAVDTATFVAGSNQQLVNSLQEKHSSKQADAGEAVKSLVLQLQAQASRNGELMAEVSKANGKVLLADQAIAAAQEQTQTSQQEQSQLAAKVARLTQLLDRREQRDWAAKTVGVDAEVSVWSECTSACSASCVVWCNCSIIAGNTVNIHRQIMSLGVSAQYVPHIAVLCLGCSEKLVSPKVTAVDTPCTCCTSLICCTLL